MIRDDILLKIKVIIITIFFTVLFSINCFAKTYELKVPFATQDLIKINAWNMVQNTDYTWGIFHKITGDLEIGYLMLIEDTDDSNIKTCTFHYIEDKYRPDVNVYEIESWVESFTDEPIHSLTSDNHITNIYE